jgi:large subunit ribosomal protein L21
MHVEKKGVRMTIYAVMKTGGKEYRVAAGDVVRVEKLAAAPGATVEIREVSSIDTGQGVTVGSLTVGDACVIAEVIGEGHGEKILIFKKKRRDHYQMISGDLQSYTELRIREIAVGENVYAAAAPIPVAPIEPVPAVATQADAPVSPRVAHEELGEAPPARLAPPPRVETAALAPAFVERATRKRSHRIAAVVAGLLVITTGLLMWGSREPQASAKVAVDVATIAAPPQAAQLSVPPPAAKAPPRKELVVKKTADASAPTAPVQPPE